nr:hypothetical protein [Tanacetum cinerariifolium]
MELGSDGGGLQEWCKWREKGESRVFRLGRNT